MLIKGSFYHGHWLTPDCNEWDHTFRDTYSDLDLFTDPQIEDERFDLEKADNFGIEVPLK